MKNMVFILDDEPHTRMDLSKNIEEAGYKVRTAATQEEANKIIKSGNIDFAIIDLMIDYRSDFGGIKVIENLNRYRPDVKIIVLTASTQDVIRNELAKINYNSFIHKGDPDKNYITVVLEELAKLKTDPPNKVCFTIMPFSDTISCKKEVWSDIFESLIKDAVENSTPNFNYKCIRASLSIGNIIKDIIINLSRSHVVIADLTDRNPNVFYELGVRHALKDATILITQNINDVPFDLRNYALVQYDWTTTKGKQEFKKKIGEVLEKIENEEDRINIVSPIREYLNLDKEHD
jgi:CheY-like chemotaxis protein